MGEGGREGAIKKRGIFMLFGTILWWREEGIQERKEKKEKWLNSIILIPLPFLSFPPPFPLGLVQTLNFGVYDNTLRYLRAHRELEQETAGAAATTAVTAATAATAVVNGNALSDYFLAGSVGGAAISVITCPASLVKIQVQTATSSSVTYWTILAGMRRKGLVAGYYR